MQLIFNGMAIDELAALALRESRDQILAIVKPWTYKPS